jgi:hypothetical protein
MSVFGDVFLLLRDLGKGLEQLRDNDNLNDTDEALRQLGNMANARSSSIRARARSSILQFPILISSSIGMKTSTMVCTALEVDYANMLRLAISSSDIVNVPNTVGSDAQAKAHFIANFHRNVKGPSIAQDIANAANAARGLQSESIEIVRMLSEGSFAETNAPLMRPFGDDGFRRTALNSATSPGLVLEAGDKDGGDSGSGKYFGNRKANTGAIPAPSKKGKSSVSDRLTGKTSSSSKSDEEEDDERNPMVTFRPQVGSTSKVNTDLKKINDLAPTILELTVQYRLQNKEGVAESHLYETQLLIAVKTIPHGVPSEEMTYFIGRSVKENNLIFRIIQWTTGEISFWKDLVLNVDQAKDDAGATNSASSFWWHKLRGLATANFMNNAMRSVSTKLFGSKKFIPNCTIVLSMTEAEKLRQLGIDVMKSDVATKICSIFFLLGLIVVDEIDEVAYIFDDDAHVYQHHSFDALSRESKEDSKELKSLLQMFGGR